MNKFDETYHSILQYVLDNGNECKDRTGVGTLSCFDVPQTVYDLTQGFPICTTKRVSFHNVLHELLWFLKGPSTVYGNGEELHTPYANNANIKYLEDNNVKIWREWSDDNGDLGPLYPALWRAWSTSRIKHSHDSYYYGETIDQIQQVIDNIKNNPWSRRLIVSAWNVHQIELMNLAPCHILFQFKVWPDKNGNPEKLDLKLYQRSADLLLGTGYNIPSYSILLTMIAHLTNLQPNKFIYCIGDAHIYLNHVDQVKEQLTREPKEAPTLEIVRDIKDIDDFKFEDFKLHNYKSHPAIKAPIAV